MVMGGSDGRAPDPQEAARTANATSAGNEPNLAGRVILKITADESMRG